MKLVFTWQSFDPGQIAFGLDAEYFTYEVEIPESCIPTEVLTAVEKGFKPHVFLVHEGTLPHAGGEV
ncbi:hypothetical protein [Treponema pedis]|uniref:hypothetical protein n=1 Tax=Treponema pedis TaxID=409322 RepID=UPI003D2591E4